MTVIAGPSFHLSGWGDVAILCGILATLSSVLGGLLGIKFNSRKSKIDQQAAEDQASDRLIRLIETEADKKVEIVRTEFRLEIAELKLAHSSELSSMRQDFEKQLKRLRDERDTYRCDHALVCTWRAKAIPPPSTLQITTES